MFKRITAFLMAMVMVAVVSIVSFAKDDVLAGEVIKANLLQKIEYTYSSAADSTAICYYTSDYFSDSSYIYNQSLSTMTLSLAFSAFGSTVGGEEDYTNKSVNARELLMKLGVKAENIEINEGYTIKPTMDSIGVIAGNMPITTDGEDYTLVAIAVRGAGYGQEWASNFTLGLEDQHQGFREAKEQVLEFLKSYFENQNISGAVKLWMTGYSRGAAVANLVAGEIDDGYVLDNDITFDLDDVFAYCFESPAGALLDEIDDQKYENIFNIINPNDIVPYVAPSYLGFGRYGVDMFIPTAESNPESYEAMKSTMLEFYGNIEGTTEYTVDDFQMKKLGMANWLPGGKPIEFIVDDTKNDYTQSECLTKYVDILAKEFFVSRDNYVSKYQDQIREICSVVFGCTMEQQKILLESFSAQAQNNWGALAWSYVWNAGINPWGDEADALQMISDWLLQAIIDAGITDYDEEVVNSAGIALGDLMLALVTSHPNYFSTLVMNVERIAEAHYPELCLAWMQSLDTNYTDENVESTKNHQAYRIVYVDGDADVNVYKNNETLVASFENGEAVYLGYSNNFGFENGVKYIILPVDNSYNVEISSNSEFAVNYTVKEYNSTVGFTRVVEFSEVEASVGEILSGSIPAYSDDEILSGAPCGSSVNYTLISSVNGEISNDIDVSRNSEFSVEATSSNEKYGKVVGTDAYKYGDVATISAKAEEGCFFKGWFENGVLVTEETSLFFNVYSNRSLVAEFAVIALTPYENNGVSVVDTTVYGMWDKLLLDSAKELFVDSETLVVNTEDYIGTGSVFTYNGIEYNIVILGDADGNGEITTTDYVRVKSAFLGKYIPVGVFEEAADTDCDGNLTATDYIRIKSHLLQRYNLFENKAA